MPLELIFWQKVAAIATIVLASSVFIAFWQIKQGRRSTDAQIAMGLFRELRHKETIDKLRLVYKLTENDLGNLSDKTKKDNDIENKRNAIDYLLDRLDTLGNLVAKGIIDKKLAIETYGGPPALRFWYKLKDYIRDEQNRRGYYGESFEGFVRLSLDYFKVKNIPVNFYWDGDKNRVDLITELHRPELRPRSLREIKKLREEGGNIMHKLIDRKNLKSFFIGLSYLIAILFSFAIILFIIKTWLVMKDAQVGFNLAIISSVIGGLILASAFSSKETSIFRVPLRRIGLLYIIATISFVILGVSAPLLENYSFAPYISAISMVGGALSFAIATVLLIKEIPRLWVCLD